MRYLSSLGYHCFSSSCTCQIDCGIIVNYCMTVMHVGNWKKLYWFFMRIKERKSGNYSITKRGPSVFIKKLNNWIIEATLIELHLNQVLVVNILLKLQSKWYFFLNYNQSLIKRKCNLNESISFCITSQA